MKYVLGIDIGTGSVKAVAVNTDCRAFGEAQRHYPFSSPKPGYHEQDPEQILRAFIDCVKEITEKTGHQPLAIGLSSALHSLIPVDENCKPLAPMITWADNRSAAIAKGLRESSEGMAIYRETGTPLHAMSPLCKIIWIRENDPSLFSKTYKFISIKEYIWYKLFNEFKIDHSCASATGLFDITKLTWHAAALKTAGVPETSLSKPVPTNYSNHQIKNPQLNFLNADTPFIIGAGDGCLANLGSMADKPGIAAITIGTSGAVRIASRKPLPNNGTMTFSYILDKDTYICGGPINNGGIAMQWWLKNISPKPTGDDYNRLFEEIGKIPAGAAGLLFLPYLTGERAPIWDSASCGNFFGIGLQHTQAHFSRAILEGICYALNDVLDAVQQNAEPIQQVNVSGGFTKADVWVQTLADITGKKMVISQSEDASAIGAGFMALKNIGLIDKYPSHPSPDAKIFHPNALNLGVYKNGFKTYRELYEALKDIMYGKTN